MLEDSDELLLLWMMGDYLMSSSSLLTKRKFFNDKDLDNNKMLFNKELLAAQCQS